MDASISSTSKTTKIQWPGGSSITQFFSLPLPIICYIALNPENPEVYNKLIQCCKYFFEVNPILVAKFFYSCGEENEIASERIGEKCFDDIVVKIDLNKLSSKLWLTRGLCIARSYFSSLIRQNLHRCEIVELVLIDTIISFDDFKYWAQTVPIIAFVQNVMITYNDGKAATFDKLLRVCPKIEVFRCDFGRATDFSMLPSTTLKDILKLPNLLNLEAFELFNVPAILDIQDVSDFLTKKLFDTTVKINFLEDVPPEYQAQVEAIKEKLVELKIDNHRTEVRSDFSLVDRMNEHDDEDDSDTDSTDSDSDSSDGISEDESDE